MRRHYEISEFPSRLSDGSNSCSACLLSGDLDQPAHIIGESVVALTSGLGGDLEGYSIKGLVVA